MTNSWETLGTVDPRRVVDARLQLHWAAQAASAPGRQLLEPRPDSSEQSLRWADGPRALAQELVNGVWPFRSALRPSVPAVVLLDAHDRVTAELLLDGHTLEEVYGWLEKEIPRRIGRSLLQPLQRPGEGLPEHGVGAGEGEGERFSVIDIAAFSEIGRWFGNAHRLLTGVAERHPAASAVRCWPHHFDIATLIALDPGAPGQNPETARSIGVGLSPGDADRPHPYFYVTPWPYPKDRELPALEGGGVWNTEGWTGAILDTPGLLRAGTGEAQAEQAERFVESAIAACLSLLARPEEPLQEQPQDQDFAAQTERSW
jgi:hypothetical protein